MSPLWGSNPNFTDILPTFRTYGADRGEAIFSLKQHQHELSPVGLHAGRITVSIEIELRGSGMNSHELGRMCVRPAA